MDGEDNEIEAFINTRLDTRDSPCWDFFTDLWCILEGDKTKEKKVKKSLYIQKLLRGSKIRYSFETATLAIFPKTFHLSVR